MSVVVDVYMGILSFCLRLVLQGFEIDGVFFTIKDVVEIVVGGNKTEVDEVGGRLYGGFYGKLYGRHSFGMNEYRRKYVGK